MKTTRLLLLAALSLLAGSCIENTLPYPILTLEILGIEGEGFTCTPEDIDTKTRVATLRLAEQTDIRRVRIDTIRVTEQAESDVPLSGTFDLRTPLRVTLSFYQDYDWTVTAEQHIERYFEVASQVGASEIDPVNRTARAYVPMDTDLNAIEVTRLKLGPEGITQTDPTPDELTSFESVRYVSVRYHDIEEKWALYVLPTDTRIKFTQLDAWSGVIWAYAEGNSQAELGFRYRETGQEEWLEVPREQIVVSGGAFRACITGLLPETSYEVIAYSGSDETETASVTTEAAPLLPNGGFEEWETLDKVVCPYLSETTRYWDTGNKGAKIANTTVTDKTTDTRPGTSGMYAAKLESKLAGALGISRLAAGNLFVGRYLKTIGANGIVGFGQPFENRPTALHGWMKYRQGLLDAVGKVQPTGLELKEGDPDNGMIFIALGDWTPEEFGMAGDTQIGTAETPVCIDTRDLSTFFDPASHAVIGYGELPLTTSTEEWSEFTIPIRYVATDRRPTHLIVVCSASRWGDYFTGSSSSVLWVDDFELIYDRLE